MCMSDPLEHVGDKTLDKAKVKAIGLMLATDGAAVVYPWDKAPDCFKAFSRAGGDEDYVIIHVGETGAWWSYQLAVCDEQTDYVGVDYLDGQGVYITITCHA